MRRLLLTLAVFALALPAVATEDLGDGNCRQTDGQVGWWNGTTTDDDGCITKDEYAEMYSAENLKEVGVIEDYTVNDDGTTTLVFPSEYGPAVTNTVETNPLDRKVAVNPELEPDAPTVGELFDRTAELSAALGIFVE